MNEDPHEEERCASIHSKASNDLDALEDQAAGLISAAIKKLEADHEQPLDLILDVMVNVLTRYKTLERAVEYAHWRADREAANDDDDDDDEPEGPFHDFSEN